MEILIYVLLIAVVAGVIRMLKSDEDNTCVRDWTRHMLITVVVGFLVFHQFGYNPLAIFGMSYFADSAFNAFIKTYKDKKSE